MILMTIAAAVALANAPQGYEVDLICPGAGTANKADFTSIFGLGAVGGAVGLRSVPFDDQVTVRISEANMSQSRIRLPSSMYSSHNRGEDGWFKLKNVKISDNQITATTTIQIANSPKIRIDRLSGVISIDGDAGHFTGSCAPYDPAAITPKF